MAQRLGLKKVDAGINGGYLEFKPTATPDPMKFIQLIQKQPAVYSFEGAMKFKFRLALENSQERLAFVVELLSKLVE